MRPRIASAFTLLLPFLAALFVLASPLLAAKKGKITLELPPPRVELADFDSGSFSNLLYTTWQSFPSEDDLNRWRDSGYYSRWEWVEDDRFLHFRGKGNALVLHDVKGDFSEIRVVTELRDDDESRQVPFNLGCILTPRQTGISGLAPTPESELARLGLEPKLGGTGIYWSRVGTIHPTSKESVHAIIERGPRGPHLAGLYIPSHFKTVTEGDNFYPVENFESEGPELLRLDAHLGSSRWRMFFEEAAAAGVEEAARALAATVEKMNDAGKAALDRYAECPDDAPLSQRCTALAVLHRDLKEAGVDSDSIAALISGPRSMLDAAFAQSIEAARGAGRDFEAETLTWVQGDPGSAETTDPAERFDGHAWVLGWLEQMAGKNLVGLLQLHEERMKSSEPRPQVAAEFIVRERHELARICERDAKTAEERGLHASAACRRLMQSALLADKEPSSFTDTEGFWWAAQGAVYGSEHPHEIAKKAARKSAMELVKRFYPFVGSYSATVGGTTLNEPGNEELLPSASVFSKFRMGIDQGIAAHRLKFANDHEIPLLSVTVLPHGSLEISMETSSEERTKEVTYTNELSNDAVVQAWVGEVNSLASEISALDERISSAVYDSNRVTDTETWEGVTSWGERSHTTTATTFESMRSAIDRVKAMGWAEDLGKERERLYKEYERVRARRPPDKLFQPLTRTERCVIEWQNWKLRFTNLVRIEGGKAPFEESFSATVEVRLARCPEAPALGIARTDRWRTEEQMRADDELGQDNHRWMARKALESYFANRVQEYMDEIRERDLTDTEKQTELVWCVYLFCVPGGTYHDVIKRQERPIEMARAHWRI